MAPDQTVSESLTLYRDGTEVASVPAGRASFPMSTDDASYRLVYDVSRDATWWPSSTDVHTEWAFASQAREPDPLPPGLTCPGSGGRDVLGPDGGDLAGCSVEPLMLTSYTTNAGIDDVIPAGEAAIVDVSVRHQRGRAPVPVVSFAADVSFDDGQTWRPVEAAPLGDGQYRLEYDQPDLDATSGFASLRIDAEDADGNTVSQVITRAYPLAVTTVAGLPTEPAESPWPACADDVLPPYASCQAMVNPAAGASLTDPSGLTPRDIRSAYGLDDAVGEGRTVAIVVAYDNPNAEADLAVYRDHFGLPACTTANGCFRKVNQRGESTDLPDPSVGWGLETSLDLDAVSAACPSCDILLVEADSSSLGDLIPAVHTAARLGADVISNSYGSIGEFSGQQYLERYYRDLRVPLVVASGDYGYGNAGVFARGVSYPAASQYAVAVGGTSLVPDATARGWSESAWAGATSGCSAYIRKPAWQRDNLCGMRTVADVSAVADPATGLAVYDTFGFDGWLQVGGTSLAAPIVASVYAMADTGEHRRYASALYRNQGGLFDVLGGSNGQCSGTYLCTGADGYDGPTGLGTPNGVGAFTRLE
jgi:hypothetical protein